MRGSRLSRETKPPMQTVKDILKKFDPLHDKYISREYQSYGVHLSEKLCDARKKSLYIRLAKNIPRAILDSALRFVIDSNARNKAALFMWKLKQMDAFGKSSELKTKNNRKPNKQS